MCWGLAQFLNPFEDSKRWQKVHRDFFFDDFADRIFFFTIHEWSPSSEWQIFQDLTIVLNCKALNVSWERECVCACGDRSTQSFRSSKESCKVTP
jgi:hypothetical protein